MKKILLTGATGFVGVRVMQYYKTKYHISILPREMLYEGDKNTIRLFAATIKPDIIIHLAAISDTGICEKRPEDSYIANVLLTETLAQAAKDASAKFILFSSDQVYNGCAFTGPYSETAILKPINIYGQHKLEAEKRALNLLPDAIVLRATWMYDMPLYGFKNRNNFVTNILNAAIQGSNITFSTTQYRSITYVREIVEKMEQTFQLPGGIYNFGSKNKLSVYETATYLADLLGIRNTIIQKDPSYNPPSLWISCDKIEQFHISFATTAEGLQRCISDYSLC